MELWKPKPEFVLSIPHVKEEERLIWDAWPGNVRSGNKRSRDLVGIGFWIKGTRVFVLWNRLEARIKALSVATDLGS